MENISVCDSNPIKIINNNNNLSLGRAPHKNTDVKRNKPAAEKPSPISREWK